MLAQRGRGRRPRKTLDSRSSEADGLTQRGVSSTRGMTPRKRGGRRKYTDPIKLEPILGRARAAQGTSRSSDGDATPSAEDQESEEDADMFQSQGHEQEQVSSQRMSEQGLTDDETETRSFPGSPASVAAPSSPMPGASRERSNAFGGLVLKRNIAKWYMLHEMQLAQRLDAGTPFSLLSCASTMSEATQVETQGRSLVDS